MQEPVTLLKVEVHKKSLLYHLIHMLSNHLRKLKKNKLVNQIIRIWTQAKTLNIVKATQKILFLRLFIYVHQSSQKV